MRAGKVVLMTGKVASGKTTYARQKETNENAVFLSIDELQLSMFGPTPTREQIDSTYEGARDYQLVVAQKFLNNGLDVYLDWGLWGRFERATIKQKILQLGYEVKVIYFYVPDEIRLEWNRKRNEGMDGASFKIAKHDLEYFDTLYEEPLDGEYEEMVSLIN